MQNWKEFFNEVEKKDYSKKLKVFLDEEYSKHVVYPTRENMFNAFKYVSPNKVKVVIIGQDPYHEPGQAMGLAFSVPRGITLPPSLVNIYKEIQNDLSVQMVNNGDLTYLAKQGVFLLNAYLTVREHEPLSHKCEMYEQFIGDVLTYLDKLDQPIVFILWGNFAKKYMKYLKNKNHLILTSSHPSPLSANRGGWFNNHHFSKTNEYLVSHNLSPIDWKN